MPTVLEINGYKFRFYSNENEEPAHIHVSKGNGIVKIWLRPGVRVEYSYNFTRREQRDIRRLVTENLLALLFEWDVYFT